MNSKEIRYQNTRYLVKESGGISAFAKAIGKGQPQTSSFAGENPMKGIGDKIAREIENAFDKPYGWLDLPHPQSFVGVSEGLADYHLSAANTLKSNEIYTFSRLTAKAAMGPGVSSQLDHDFEIATLQSTKKWAQKHLSQASNLNDVKIITGIGDSMEPTFRDGDALFVDTKINKIEYDSIYVFTFDDNLFIKRISRVKNTLKVISDNKAYESWEISPKEFDQLKVIGRVIGLCTWQDL